MKSTNEINLRVKRILEIFGRYKYLLIVIFVGVIFLMIPASNTTEVHKDSAVSNDVFSVEAHEDRLEAMLAAVEGAGQVKVMLSVACGTKMIYAKDEGVELNGGEASRQSNTVIISTGSGIQQAVVEQQMYPQFLGALIVAEGGGDPSIQLKLTEAVAAVTGLGADKISVCKGK